MNVASFVRNYALNCYTFDHDPEALLVARLIFKYMKGKRVLDLGCGPIVPITSIFYPQAKEVVAVDRLQENLGFIKKNSHELESIVIRAKAYRTRYLSKKNIQPKIQLVKGDVTKYMPQLGLFDSVMNIGCFGSLDTAKQFQQALNHAYSYLKKGGTLLMMNWIGTNVKRPFHFNGKVDELSLYVPAMQKAGFKVKEIHLTSKLSKETKEMGYQKIIWAVAKK